MDVAGQLALHHVARPWPGVARNPGQVGQVGEVGQAGGRRGGGPEPFVQLVDQLALQQGDEQRIAGEQGGDHQQQADRHQAAAQGQPFQGPAGGRRPHGRGLRST